MSQLPVSVEARGQDTYEVRVESRSRHTVRAAADVLQRVAAPGESAEKTIERAFHFLLEREPPEAILSTFSLEVIGRYFPDFWDEMTKY